MQATTLICIIFLLAGAWAMPTIPSELDCATKTSEYYHYCEEHFPPYPDALLDDPWTERWLNSDVDLSENPYAVLNQRCFQTRVETLRRFGICP